MSRSLVPLAALLLTLVTIGEAGQAGKHIGCYYGVWAYTRPGLGEFWPEDIDVSLCDVIYYGFGNVLNSTFEVCSWDPWFDMGPSDFGEKSIKNCIQERDGDVWTPGCVTTEGLEYCHYDGIRRTIALKEKNPNLKVLFSVGGWTAGGWIFSQMAQTRDTRLKFIQSIVHFMDYFGFDGLDLDWEFPAFDMLPEVPTDPEDKQHFTSLMKELRNVFDKHSPPFLLTFASASDPYKAGNAYELDKVHPHVDWINVMCYDYHGAWDNFTGIDQPMYGKWEEGFEGHPMYQFNLHDSIQYYLDEGVPSEKIVLGIHTEGKGWILGNPATPDTCPGPDCQAGIYCPASSGSPNMTYSQQEGWMFYYEVLQFYYNDTLPDYQLPPLWEGLKPGIKHWTVFDHANNNQDGCYRSPYAYQGKYWISYDDEYSVNIKSRYANHYGLLGAFIWEVDTDNFQGLFGKEPYTLLAEISRTISSKEGLTDSESLGHANENMGRCAPEYQMCDPGWDPVTPPTLPTGPTQPTTPAHQCNEDTDCNEDDDVVCDPTYSNCFHCAANICKPGCSTNTNCGGLPSVCTGAHICATVDHPVVVGVTVQTESCTDCSTEPREEGLQLQLTGLMDLVTCVTDNLDNPHRLDYVAGGTAEFDSRNGIGGCGIDLYQSVDSANAMWTGPGTWAPNTKDTVCVDFYGDENPSCCCSLARSLTASDGWVAMSGCHCD